MPTPKCATKKIFKKVLAPVITYVAHYNVNIPIVIEGLLKVTGSLVQLKNVVSRKCFNIETLHITTDH